METIAVSDGSAPPSLLSELRRRNVIRLAGLYLVGAWIIVQVSETLLPIFDTPGWVLKALVVLLAIGFLPALVFSWIYELTPEGLKRDADVTPSQSIAAQTGRRMDRLIFAGIIALIAVIAADRYWPRDAGAGRCPLPACSWSRLRPLLASPRAPRPARPSLRPAPSPCCRSSTCRPRATRRGSPTASARKC
jgi:hypothetical protein